ncbi:MAG: hypothetical protein ACMG6E_03355 [Candidatus Roizmanbacteria bacterium]
MNYESIDEIKQHPWCADVDWSSLIEKKQTPPWLPNIEQSNFDPEYTTLPLDFT